MRLDPPRFFFGFFIYRLVIHHRDDVAGQRLASSHVGMMASTLSPFNRRNHALMPSYSARQNFSRDGIVTFAVSFAVLTLAVKSLMSLSC